MYKENTFTGRLNTIYSETGLSVEDFAKRCNVSRSAMKNYLNGDRIPDSLRLLDFCREFSVSADWMMGLSEVRKISADIKAAVEYSGLPEETIVKIASFPDKYKAAFSKLIGCTDFWTLLHDFDMYLTVLNNLEGDEEAYDEEPELERKVTFDADKYLKIPFEQSLQLLAGAIGKDMTQICNELEYQKHKVLEQYYHNRQD